MLPMPPVSGGRLRGADTRRQGHATYRGHQTGEHEKQALESSDAHA
jgi:hypothetical protein